MREFVAVAVLLTCACSTNSSDKRDSGPLPEGGSSLDSGPDAGGQDSGPEYAWLGWPCDEAHVCAEGTCCELCVDTDESSQNCGACGVDCGPYAQCVAGECVAGECEDLLCGPRVCCQSRDDEVQTECVNLTNDPANCGGCHHACAGAEWCRDGACSCPVEDHSESYAVCGGECVAVYLDARHCGACGVACPAERRICRYGACYRCEELDEPMADCGQHDCTDLQWDPDHCGACGRACADDEQCVRGECVHGNCGLDCPPNAPVCCVGVEGPFCVDLLGTFEHCGACGDACDPDDFNVCTYRAECTWVGP